MPSPQAYLVQAIRRIWRYSAARKECLKKATNCYVCGKKFPKRPVYSIKKGEGGEAQTGQHLYDLFRNKKYICSGFKTLLYRRKKDETKTWRKLYAPQADHVESVGPAPKDWTGWDTYLQRMFGHTLLPICRKCHQLKTNKERAERAAEKKKEKNA